MVKQQLLIVFAIFPLLVNCNYRGAIDNKLFVSEVIRDTVSSYLEWVDSIPNEYHFPTITLMELTETNGKDYLIFWSYPGWGGQSHSKDSEEFAYGRFHGKLLYIVGNKKFKSWGRWRLLKLSREDKKKEHYLASHHLIDMFDYGCGVDDLYTAFSMYQIISPDSLILIYKNAAITDSAHFR